MEETVWIAHFAMSSYRAWMIGSKRGRFSHLSNVEFPIECFMGRMGESVHKIVCDVFEERCRLNYGNWRAMGEIHLDPKGPDADTQLRRSIDDEKARWVDGTPMNTAFTWGLKLLFPEAQFIHLLRRPEDVVASLMKFEQAGGINQSTEQGLMTWLNHTYSAVLARRGFGPDVVLTVEYADLIADTTGALEQICNFLGEAFHPDCLLPFRKRINSSKLGEERAELIRLIRSKSAFAESEALYSDALRKEVSVDECKKAMSELQSSFMKEFKAS